MLDRPLTGNTTVRDVVIHNPGTFSVFEAHGMCDDCRTSPPSVPLHHFSQKHEVPLEQLIAELSEVLGPEG